MGIAVIMIFVFVLFAMVAIIFSQSSGVRRSGRNPNSDWDSSWNPPFYDSSTGWDHSSSDGGGCSSSDSSSSDSSWGGDSGGGDCGGGDGGGGGD